MRRYHCLPILIVLAAGLAACSPSEPEWHGRDITGVMPDLAYSLTDENGKAVDASDHAGRVRLLFFGFTHCPDACPTTLARLRAAIGMLDPARREHIRVLFVSVDPERDTPKRLRQYTDNFGNRFVGMTGSQAQLREMTDRYSVTYRYGVKNENGEYNVAHNGAVFLFDSEGEIRLLFNQSVPAADIAADLRRLVDEIG